MPLHQDSLAAVSLPVFYDWVASEGAVKKQMTTNGALCESNIIAWLWGYFSSHLRGLGWEIQQSTDQISQPRMAEKIGIST